MLKFYFLLACCAFTSILFSQSHVFYGVLKLNGNNENAITYRLVFTEKNGIVSGYSVTDVAGPHETKTLIDGTYNYTSKILKFKEKDIVYTKSTVSDNLFCFVNFEGKLKLSAQKTKIENSFKGLFKNNTKCIDGTISLLSAGTVNSLLNKVSKKIQKSKELNATEKTKYNPVQIFDSLQTNQLTTSQNLNVFYKTEKVSFNIWDKETEDGDMINIFHNNKVILANYIVTKVRKKIEVTLDAVQNVFKIEAVNEGLAPPNTAMIVLEGDKVVEFQSNLKKGETASITIIRQ